MSKIEVNTVEPQCGTTLTLGGSGDTIALGSGASQTGFGREGSVDWQTGSIKTGTFTPTSGEGYFVNTSGGISTVNLPAGVAGSIVAIADYTRTFNSNNCTVEPNGAEKIGGVADGAVLDVNGQSATFVYVDGTEGWINVQETQTSVTGTPPYILATVSGACNTLATAPCCANTKIATFLGPGTFCVSDASPCAANNVVSYMVVAGGGAGGTDNQATSGGGGGAGGFREYKSPVTPYTASPLDGNPGGCSVTVSATSYPIDIGGGGSPVPPASGPPNFNPGTPSTFSTITSTAGGGGASNTASTCNPAKQGGPGGSGGAANYYNAPAIGTGNTPPVSPSQGFDGGAGAPGLPGSGGPFYSSGGGGGAAAVGTNGTTTVVGVGGGGVTTSISATPTAYAGGGGGATWAGVGCGGAGGSGGGGAGGKSSVGVDGTDNLGGGGGGSGGHPGTNYVGGSGGSGIVIIRYKFQ